MTKTSTTSTKMIPSSAGQRALRAAAALCAALALCATAAAGVEQPSPRAVIQHTIDQVLAILRDTKRDNTQRRAELEAIAKQRFDFTTMSKLVMAANWRRLSKPQQSEFVDEFTRFLANDYGARIERYDQEQVEITGEQSEPRGDYTIKTKIVGGDHDGALVDYRMRERDGNWRIIDVVIEGISLVANYRDQFREVASNGGPAVVIQRLKEKNAAGDAAAKPS
jgi:phospholipid transport system substrate-binding protein